jgi:hypothetical protein
LHVDCSEFLRHKQTVIRPDLLAVRPCAVLQWPVCCSVIAQPKSSVRVDFAWQDEGFGVGRTVQHMHDFVVTMPGAYHTGFNCGHARSLARSLALSSLTRSFIAVELLFASKRAVQHKLCRGCQLLL